MRYYAIAAQCVSHMKAHQQSLWSPLYGGVSALRHAMHARCGPHRGGARAGMVHTLEEVDIHEDLPELLPHIPAPPWVRHSCICDGNACIVWSFTVCVHGYFCHAFCAGMHCIGDSYIVLYISLQLVCIAISVSHHSATACIVSMLLVVSMSNFIGMVGYATHHSATAVHTVHSLCEGCWMVWVYRCYRL